MIDVSPGERPALVVERAQLEQHILLTGELEAADSIDLMVPRTDSWQLSIRWMADEGKRVAAGERLLEFDNSSLTEKLREMELAIVRADNALAQQVTTDAVAVADKELEVERQRVEVAKAKLDADLPRSLIPAREWEDSQVKLERARTALANAEDDLVAARKTSALERDVKQIDLDKAERDYERALAELDELVLKAPREGVMVIAEHPWFGRRLQVGDVVRPGFTAVRVSDLAVMQVVAQLSDVDDGRVVPGMVASCVLDAYPDRVFPGKVTRVSEIARELSETSTRRFFKVTIELSETDTTVMRPGMSVRAEVLAGAQPAALIAPRAGLDLDGEAPRALLAAGGERELEVGFCTPTACAVTGGLSEGERLRYQEVAP